MCIRGEAMKREVNKQYTRELLIKSALELLCKRDYHKVTVEEIARSAGVTKTTFFAHFRSKEDILYEVDIDQLATLDEQLGSYLMNEEFYRNLVNAVVEMAQNLHYTPILTQNLIHLGTISTEYRKSLSETFTNLKLILMKHFEKAQTHGLITREITAKRVAEDFVIIYTGVMVRWSFFDETSSLVGTLREALINYSSGIQIK